MDANKTFVIFQINRNEKAVLKALAKRLGKNTVSGYLRLKIEQDAKLAGLIPPTQ